MLQLTKGEKIKERKKRRKEHKKERKEGIYVSIDIEPKLMLNRIKKRRGKRRRT